MKKVIIGIHGLRNKPPKYLLKKWWKKSLKEGLVNHDYKILMPKFEMVYWADVLYDKPLNKRIRDPKSPYFLDEIYKPSPQKNEIIDISKRLKITSYIAKKLNKIFLNPDKSLNFSFIGDFILERFFKDLNAYYDEKKETENELCSKTKQDIQKRLIKQIKRYQNHEIMIVAHSMGSIIAYDVLNYLLQQKKIHTLVSVGSPLGLPLVISKIAQENQKAFQAPDPITTPENVEKYWFNLADARDMVSIDQHLGDNFVANKKGVKPIDLKVINDYENNPHKSYGYLRCEEMSEILNDFIGGTPKTIGGKLRVKIKNVVKDIKGTAVKVKERLNIELDE